MGRLDCGEKRRGRPGREPAPESAAGAATNRRARLSPVLHGRRAAAFLRPAPRCCGRARSGRVRPRVRSRRPRAIPGPWRGERSRGRRRRRPGAADWSRGSLRATRPSPPGSGSSRPRKYSIVRRTSSETSSSPARAARRLPPPPRRYRQLHLTAAALRARHGELAPKPRPLTGQPLEGGANSGQGKEPATASAPKRDARQVELSLEQNQLSIRAGEHSEARPRTARHPRPPERRDDTSCLFAGGLVADDRRRASRRAWPTRNEGNVRPRPRLRPGPIERPSQQHRRGDGENSVGRAVVQGEPDHAAARMSPGKSSSAPVTPVPGVDRLVGIADDAKIVVPAEPGFEETYLRRVHILVFVDEDMTETPAGRCGEVGVLLELVRAT